MDDSNKLTLADLIAWGRDYARLLQDGPPPGEAWHVSPDTLRQYLAAANEAMQRQCDQDREQDREQRKTSRPRGGRPRGGMADQRKRFVANGVADADADRITAQAHRKPIESVRRAGQRVQKTPRS